MRVIDRDDFSYLATFMFAMFFLKPELPDSNISLVSACNSSITVIIYLFYEAKMAVFVYHDSCMMFLEDLMLMSVTPPCVQLYNRLHLPVTWTENCCCA